MIVTWRFLSILSLVRYTESECSSTSYYRNCWIRRFPGLHVDADESQRRGAQLLQRYRGDSAQNCSRTCCLTSNFSCNVAVFHYNTTQDSVNCFHLHCPTLQSCILHQRANVILYNVTKGMDPDLLIFGKFFPSDVQVLPQVATVNTSDLSGTDKRQFNRPHMEPNSTAHPNVLTISPRTSTHTPPSSFPMSTPPPFSVYSTQDNQDRITASAVHRSTTLKRSSQIISTRIITNPSTDPTIVSTTTASPAPKSTTQPSFSLAHKQTSSMSQPAYTSSTTITPSQLSSQITSSSTSSSQVALQGTMTTMNQTASPDFKIQPNLISSTTLSHGYITTPTTPIPIPSIPGTSTEETTTMPVPLTDTPRSISEETTTLTVRLSSTLQSSTGWTSAMLVTLLSAPQSIKEATTTTPVHLPSTLQSRTGKTSTTPVPLSSGTKENNPVPVPLSSTLISSTGETKTTPVPLSSISQSSAGETTTTPVPMSSAPQSITREATTRSDPLSSIPQSRNAETTAHTTLPTVQVSSGKASLSSTPLTPTQTPTGYVTTTTEPLAITNSFTTTSWNYNQPVNTQSTASPLIEKKITPSSRTGGLSQAYINLASTDVSVNTVRLNTLNRLQSSAPVSKTNSGLNTSPTTPTIVEDSQPYPNDTKSHASRNVTSGNSPQPVSDGGLTQVWHLAANTVLVALATCAALACGCCCSVLMAASWRGRRRRKGRYQTTLKGKKGSMRLIKYVFVRESS